MVVNLVMGKLGNFKTHKFFRAWRHAKAWRAPAQWPSRACDPLQKKFDSALATMDGFWKE
jgi:hypothetical protein